MAMCRRARSRCPSGRDLASFDELLDGVHRCFTLTSERPDATRTSVPGGKNAHLRISGTRIYHRSTRLPCCVATTITERYMLASSLDDGVAVATMRSALTLRVVIESPMRHGAEMETALSPSPIRMRLKSHVPRLPFPRSGLHLAISADKPGFGREMLTTPGVEVRARAKNVWPCRGREDGTSDLTHALRVRALPRHDLTLTIPATMANPGHSLRVDTTRQVTAALIGTGGITRRTSNLSRRCGLLPNQSYPMFIGAKPLLMLRVRRSSTPTTHLSATARQTTRADFTTAAKELLVTRGVILLFRRSAWGQFLMAQRAITSWLAWYSLAQFTSLFGGIPTLGVIRATTRLLRGSGDRYKVSTMVTLRPRAAIQRPALATMVSIVTLKRAKLLIAPFTFKNLAARRALTPRHGERRMLKVYHFNLSSPLSVSLQLSSLPQGINTC